MKKLYIGLWIVSIVFVIGIFFSSAVMFANDGGVLGGVFDFEDEDEDEEETKKRPSSTTKRPSSTTEVPIEPGETTRPDVGSGESATTTKIPMGTEYPELPEYPDNDYFYTDGLEFALNEDGKSYSVTDGTRCKDSKIVIPLKYNGLPVTRIASYAFYRHHLEEIEFPETVQVIGAHAFMGCENLTYVDLPYYLVTIEKSAFASCTSLKMINVYEHLNSIGAVAFSNCTSLENIDFWGKNWNDIEKGTGWDSGCPDYEITKG